MNKYLINTKRWFDKINGNTYFSLQIIDLKNNKEIVNKPFNYGYGDFYKQEAYKQLINLKLVKEKDYINHNLNKKRFIYNVVDVARKKDL